MLHRMNDKTLHIYYICNEYPPRDHGGIGTFVKYISKSMADAGHKVTIVEIGDTSRIRTTGKIKIVTIGNYNIKYLRFFIDRYRLFNWLKNNIVYTGKQIVEAYDYSGLLPFKLQNCPVVVRLHLSQSVIRKDLGLRLSFFYKWSERRTLSANKQWISVSRWILDKTIDTFKVKPNLFKIIYNPITTEYSKKEINKLPKKYIVSVGYVGSRKGSFALAQAVRSIMSEMQDLHLIYVGAIQDVNAKQKIRDIVGDDLAERVHFVGRLEHSDALKYMANAKVFVLPSKVESFGLVAVEAMSMGTPVIFTNVGPGKEIIKNGKTGLLVDPNSVEEIKFKISLVLKNDSYAKYLVENALKDIDGRFSLEKCKEDTEKYYKECLKRWDGK